jgi:hypothetical protein
MAAPKGNKFAKGNKGGGGPTAYKPHYATQAIKACQAGFTDRELGVLFGVSEATIALSSSGFWTRENSTAKPLSRWRTTRPAAFPTRTVDPICGRLRLTTATPETDRSTMAHCSWVPSGNTSVTI